MLLNCSYSKWREYLPKLVIKEDAYFEDRKFDAAKMVLKTMSKLFFDETSLKYIIERNKYLNGI